MTAQCFGPVALGEEPFYKKRIVEYAGRVDLEMPAPKQKGLISEVVSNRRQ
jgi:hypothetical protein